MGFNTYGLLALTYSLVAAAAVSAGEAEPCRVRVIEGRAAVFATTNAVREAVVWLPAGAECAVRGELTEDPWVCVEPPENVSVWIYRELVRDGLVRANKSRLRSGAGLNFRPVGSLNKGDRVEVRGAYGDWFRIRPPREVNFWILRDQVEPLAAMSPESVETNLEVTVAVGIVTNEPVAVTTNAVSAIAPAPVVIVKPLRVPPELRGFVLDNMTDQGSNVVLSGLLDWGTVGAVSAPFCLVVQQANGDSTPVCHVMASALTYSPFIGSRVVVEGTSWRVKGSELPVIIPTRVRVQN